MASHFNPTVQTPFGGLAGLRPGKPLSDLFGLFRQRRALARLDADALADIGVSRAEALAEANRAIWDVPAHWQA